MGAMEFQGRLWVPARYAEGASLQAFSVGAVLSMGQTASGDVFVNVGKLTASTYGQRSLVIVGPAGLGAGSQTQPSGMVTFADGYPMQALYTGDAPQAGDLCGPYPSGTQLKRYFPGFRALHAGAGGGVWVIKDDWPGLILAKVSTSIQDKDTPGEAELYADETLSMNISVEAWDPLLTEDDDPIAADTWVWVGLDGKGYWCVHEPRCSE